VVVEATFSFGWSGRNSAACWRRRLRCEEQLTSLEKVLTVELADPTLSTEVTLVGASHCCDDDARYGGPVTVALLDDEPHASVDKKLKAKRTTSVADPGAAEADAAGRSVGIAPAVAQRLEVVLALCAVRGQQALEEQPVAAV
jgi:hypothetical protein